jgi:hypothetical protein
MDKIIIHFIFADESVMEFKSFEVALEFLNSYFLWKADVLQLDRKEFIEMECDILKKVVVSGLAQSQEQILTSQIERFSPSIN